MTALRWMPGGIPLTVELLEPDAGEAIAAVPHTPPAAFPAAPRRQYTPVTAIVGTIQSELGIRVQRLDGYGPTSAFSERLLLRAYGVEDLG